MRTRSGKSYGCAASPAVSTKKRARAKRTRPAPTIANIERRIIERAQEKKRFELARTSTTTKRTFNSYLLGSEIQSGAASYSRTGDSIILTRVYLKYILSISPQAAALPYHAPLKFHLYVVQAVRNANPQSYWYQNFNDDNNVDFTGDPLTPAGDVLRQLRKLNKREIKVLAHKVVTVGPRSPSDSQMCATRTGTLLRKN